MSKDGLSVLISSPKCFFRALSSVAAVVLLIQDLAWSDIPTLNVLEAILTDSEMKRAFPCATLQEVEPERECFLRWQERVKKSTGKIGNGFQATSIDDLDIKQVQGLKQLTWRVISSVSWQKLSSVSRMETCSISSNS